MTGDPNDVVTFFFTDIEGSTRLWELHPDAMREALVGHDAIVADTVAAHRGRVFSTAGDSFSAAFADPAGAVRAAIDVQRRIREAGLPVPVRVRAALHSGPAEHRDDDYFGPTLNRCARLLVAAHGGQVLLSDAARVALGDALPAAASLRDLGPQRLRDLSSPIRAFQLVHPDLIPHFPPLRSLDAYRHNLPTQLTSFVGRVAELAVARQILSDARMVTFTGAGGSGKSRLTLQLAAEEVESFADGVWLVELAATRRPEDVLLTVGDVLGAEAASAEVLRDRIADSIGDGSILLIFDNAEHQLDATATLIDRLLRDCERLKVIVTSREPVGVAGEVVHRVPPMAVEDQGGDAEAVRLFVDRARRSRDDFELKAANEAAVTEIVRRLDGLPLAIELAAGRVSALAPEEIAARLDDRFRLLTAGSRTAVDRQQTLQAAMDWGYDLLTPVEQAVFRRLSVFRGGFTLPLAEAVCTGDDIDEAGVFDSILHLVDKSLVNPAETKAGTRYRLFQTVRQHGREKLDEMGETPDAIRRHAEAFLTLAEDAEQHMRGPDEPGWLRKLDPERDNFRGAMHYFMSLNDPTAALRLADGLRTFLSVRGGTPEALGWLLDLTSRADAVPPLLLARSLSWAGFLLEARGDSTRGEAYVRRSIADIRALDSPAELGTELMRLGYLLIGRGRLAEAKEAAEEAIPLLKASKRRWALGFSVSLLGWIARSEGLLNTAQTLYGEALEILRETGHDRGVAGILEAIGSLALAGGNFDHAGELLEEALSTFQRVGSRVDVVTTTLLLGDVEALYGDPSWAHSLYTEATLQWNRKEAPDLTPTILASWALLARRVNRPAVAAVFWGMEYVVRGDGAPTADRVMLRDHELEALRDALDDEEFNAQWRRGEAISLEEAIDLALDLDEHYESESAAV